MLVEISGAGSSSVRVMIGGALDEGGVWDLRLRLSSLLSDRPAHVAIDLSNLRMIDDAGVGVLVAFCRRLRFRSGRATLMGLHGQPLTAFGKLAPEEVRSSGDDGPALSDSHLNTNPTTP